VCQAMAPADACSSSASVHRLLGIVLPEDGDHEDSPCTADLYLATAASSERAQPVVVVLPGFAGPKEAFSMLATALAEAGYATMVVSQLRSMAGKLPEGMLVRTPSSKHTQKCPSSQ
jgi:dienelactone hydrolase